MAILTDIELDVILKYLEKAIQKLAIEASENLELDGGFQEMKNFLQSQFDIRLENLLKSKDSSIHHLESGMKNKVIQKKQEIIERVSRQYQN